MKKILQFPFLLLVTVLLVVSCTAKQPTFTVKAFETEQGWGYSIFENKKLIIKQVNIPAIQKQKSFKNERDALKIGFMVIEKLKQHKIPSLTNAEVKNNISL